MFASLQAYYCFQLAHKITFFFMLHLQVLAFFIMLHTSINIVHTGTCFVIIPKAAINHVLTGTCFVMLHITSIHLLHTGTCFAKLNTTASMYSFCQAGTTAIDFVLTCNGLSCCTLLLSILYINVLAA